MDESTQAQPWARLEQLVDDAKPKPIENFLEALPRGEAVLAISRLDNDYQSRLLKTLPAEGVADLLETMPDAQAVDLIEQLDPGTAAAIVHELPSNEQADLLGDLTGKEADAILAEMDRDEARDLRRLSEYPDDSAGGLMVTELLAYRQTMTVSQVIEDLRVKADAYRDFQVQYAFVVDARRCLRGVLRMRDLLLAQRGESISALMIPRPLTVADDSGLDALREFFDEHDFLGAPVVNEQGQLLGLVQRSAVEEALGERVEDEYRKAQGIVREELRTMPTWVRAQRRLAWLSVNILLNVFAAGVIAAYQETLASVIALAVFLPIISDMSGCSGNQAVAVSMRELALGLVRPGEVFRVVFKEVVVGAINGLALGGLIGLVALAWKGNWCLGLVVGGALALNTLIAVSLGGALPLLMKLLRMDPALASGPILTTITDMCGFFLVLSMATGMLPWLQV